MRAQQEPEASSIASNEIGSNAACLRFLLEVSGSTRLTVRVEAGTIESNKKGL
jgi:hypothetical protein